MDESSGCWLLTKKDKEKFISALTSELVLLRTKAEISQEELAVLIGTSRQTYGAIERKERRMSWSMFLSLVLFYDYNQKTHQMIRNSDAFPYDIIKHFNAGMDLQDVELGSLIGNDMKTMIDSLDEQALNSIRTLVMVEYARCTNTPGDIVVKSFDGKRFYSLQQTNLKVTQALKAIKEQSKQNDKSGS